jgi:hypothetical protein
MLTHIDSCRRSHLDREPLSLRDVARKPDTAPCKLDRVIPATSASSLNSILVSILHGQECWPPKLSTNTYDLHGLPQERPPRRRTNNRLECRQKQSSAAIFELVLSLLLSELN